MSAAVLSGLLVAAALARFRIRPDHRLRHLGPTPPTRTRSGPARPFRLPHRTAPCGPADLAAYCDALAREVRAGATLAAALRSVAPPAGSRLGEIAERLDRGHRLLDAVSTRSPGADEQAVLTVLAACADHGGSAAPPLDRVAATLRRRAADAAERSVHSAQARLSALVMTLLPGGVLVLLVITSAPVRAATRTPAGAVVVALGLALNATGWWWMRRIIGGVR